MNMNVYVYMCTYLFTLMFTFFVCAVKFVCGLIVVFVFDVYTYWEYLDIELATMSFIFVRI